MNNDLSIPLEIDNSLIDGIVISEGNHPGKVTYISDTFYKLTGYSKEELAGMSALAIFKKIIYEDDYISFFSEMADAIEQKNDKVHITFRIVDKSGKIKWIEDIAKYTYDKDYNLSKSSIILLDVSYTKNIQINNDNRSVYQKAIIEASSFLVNPKTDSIPNVLKIILEITSATSVYIYINHSENNKIISNIEYFLSNNPNTEILPDYKRIDFKKEGLERWLDKFNNKEFIFGSMDIFPNDERIFLSKANFLYFTAFPIFFNKRLYGFVSLGYTDKSYKSGNSTFAFLNFMSRILSTFFMYRKNNKNLAIHSKYEKGLSMCSQLALENDDNVTNMILKVVSRTIPVQYLAVIENTDNNTRFKITHELSDSKQYINSSRSFKETFNPNVLLPILDDLSNGRIVMLKSDDFSHSLADMVKYKFNMQTFILIPFFVEGKWFGCISLGFHYINDNHILNKDSLFSLGNILGTYYSKKHFREALIKSNEELKEAIMTKDQMLSIISHDLKNPMNSILGFSSLITDIINTATDEDIQIASKSIDINDIQEYNNVIHQSSIELISLLENILIWSRTLRNKIHPMFTQTNIYEVCSTAIAINAGIVKNKRINIILEVPNNISIVLDMNMLKTIIRNLLSNAIKFTNEGKSIRISALQNKNTTTISIKDEGIGMSKDTLNHLFNKNDINSKQGTNGEKGTGLGLLVVDDFIKKMNGEIKVESTLNEGSTFQIIFPNDNTES